MTKMNGRILIVDDEPTCRNLSRLIATEGLIPLVAQDAEMALEMISSELPDVLLVGNGMPGFDGMEVLRRAKRKDENLSVILITGDADGCGSDEAMKAGANGYVAKPFTPGEVIRVVLWELGQRGLQRKPQRLSDEIKHASLRELMGTSKAVSQLVSDVERVAWSTFSVVILGETGSGKEVVAKAIHQASPRSSRPFVPVDCGAIPEGLVESELYGYEKGAFTGALARQPGKFEAAAGGTLFLDEVSNLPLGSQAKLLRSLQEKTICRVGSTVPTQVDVRVLAATNLDLNALTELGSFRHDLLFRLNEFTIMIPPLRERKEDILYLAKRFVDITNVELSKFVTGFSESAIEELLTYSWPGNVRELRSTVRRAALLADGVIRPEHLNLKRVCDLMRPTMGMEARRSHLPLREIVRRNVIAVEREVLAQTLRQTNGNKAKAARLLQIDYKTIHSKVKGYGISVDP